MIDARKEGLLFAKTLVITCALPLLFVTIAILGVELTGHIQYDFINFPLYLAAIIAAALLTANIHEKRELTGFFRASWTDAFRRANISTALLALCIFTIVWATKDKAISRIFLGTYLASAWICLFLIHHYALGALSHILFRGSNKLKTVLIGRPANAYKIMRWQDQGTPVGMEVVGLVSDDVPGVSVPSPVPVLGPMSRMEEILSAHQPQQVILLETRLDREHISRAARTSLALGARLLIYHQWEEYINQPLTTLSDGEHSFFALQQEPLENPFHRFTKRLFDIVFASVVCVTVLPVLCAVIHYYQRKQSPGPLFYRQQRSGFYKKEFNILKFRTMHVRPSGDESIQAHKGDPRIFPAGEWLRRRSLDEIPQFLNVLYGNMSVVGPRPHLLEHDSEFQEVIETYRIRSFIKPGITGLAQVSGFRGEIDSPEKIRQRIRYDIRYINNWSIWLDMQIIVRTVVEFLSPSDKAR